jgi:hypothetical protein
MMQRAPDGAGATSPGTIAKAASETAAWEDE